MSVEKDYIDRSIATIAGIDPEQLGIIELGELIGAGTTLTTYALGSLSIEGRLKYLALKTSTIGAGTPINARFCGDIAVANVIAGRAYQLLPKLPAFMGLVEIEGEHEAKGILTEDVTRGLGSSAIHKTFISPESLEILETAFSEDGSLEQVFTGGIDLITHHMPFIAEGQERLLDMPRLRGYPFFNKEGLSVIQTQGALSEDKAFDLEDSLKIVIKRGSKLARSLTKK